MLLRGASQQKVMEVGQNAKCRAQVIKMEVTI